VWAALWHPAGTEDDIVVNALRLPRTVLGLAVGIALGVDGALMQGHTRNPLADPGLLGVTAGAAFLVVFGIYALHVTSLYGYVWFAFTGALAAGVAVFLLGAVSPDGPTPVTLALAGVAVSALLGALTSALVLLDTRTLDAFRFWAVGSLAGRDGEVVAQVAPFLCGRLTRGRTSRRPQGGASAAVDTSHATPPAHSCRTTSGGSSWSGPQSISSSGRVSSGHVANASAGVGSGRASAAMPGDAASNAAAHSAQSVHPETVTSPPDPVRTMHGIPNRMPSSVGCAAP
jgi:hypothetical protein